MSIFHSTPSRPSVELNYSTNAPEQRGKDESECISKSGEDQRLNESSGVTMNNGLTAHLAVAWEITDHVLRYIDIFFTYPSPPLRTCKLRRHKKNLRGGSKKKSLRFSSNQILPRTPPAPEFAASRRENLPSAVLPYFFCVQR